MSDELKALARAYGDESISQAELQRLDGLLQGARDAREQFLREMNLTDALEDMALADRSRLNDQDLSQPPTTTVATRRFTWKRWASLAVAAAILLVFTSIAWRNSDSPIIGTIVDVHGTVRWTGQNGVVVEQLQIADSLPGGTLEVLAADAWASFRFHDGSIVTLSGEAEAVLSDRDQKRLHLRDGSMSANVQPQPTDSPMIVQTPAADIEVLGTQFNVSARTTNTELAVNEGRVRFLRSSDGKELEVPAEHRAFASLDSAEDFTIQRRGPQFKTWQSRLESDVHVMHGYWKPALFELEAKLKQAVSTGEITEAEALAEYKQAISWDRQGSVWAQPSKIGCLVWLDVQDENGRPVLLTDQTQIRITGRLIAAANLEMGMSVYAVDGGFLGKFSREISAQELDQSADGNFEWVVRGSEVLSKSKSDVSASGSLVHDWWCVTDSNTAKLEIVRVEILNR